jgi:mannose-6-phosphate isomerase
VDAAPGAAVALGLQSGISADALGAAARDGSIADRLLWHEVSAGDLIHVPAGTIHAIGAGLHLIEVQQNVDVTYRLFDYGRPRELHITDAVAVARAEPFDAARGIWKAPHMRNRVILSDPAFRLALADHDAVPAGISGGAALWVAPLAGTIACADAEGGPGACLYAADPRDIMIPEGALALLAFC